MCISDMCTYVTPYVHPYTLTYSNQISPGDQTRGLETFPKSIMPQTLGQGFRGKRFWDPATFDHTIRHYLHHHRVQRVQTAKSRVHDQQNDRLHVSE